MVQIQIPAMIENADLYEVTLYRSGLIMVMYLWQDNAAKVMIDTVPEMIS